MTPANHSLTAATGGTTHRVDLRRASHRQRFLLVLHALGFPVLPGDLPMTIRFTSPAPLSSTEAAALLWLANTAELSELRSQPAETLRLPVVVAWYESWGIGQEFARRLPLLGLDLPAEMTALLARFLATVQLPQAVRVLGFFKQALSTEVVARAWTALVPQDEAEARHLRARWFLWLERYREGSDPGNPLPPVPAWMFDGWTAPRLQQRICLRTHQ